MNSEDMLLLFEYIAGVSELQKAGLKGKELVDRNDALIDGVLKRIKSNDLRRDLRKLYEKNIKKYIFAVAKDDDLELI